MKKPIEHIDWLLLRAYDSLHAANARSARTYRSVVVNDAMATIEFLRGQRWQALCRSRKHKGRGKAKS